MDSKIGYQSKPNLALHCPHQHLTSALLTTICSQLQTTSHKAEKVHCCKMIKGGGGGYLGNLFFFFLTKTGWSRTPAAIPVSSKCGFPRPGVGETRRRGCFPHCIPRRALAARAAHCTATPFRGSSPRSLHSALHGPHGSTPAAPDLETLAAEQKGEALAGSCYLLIFLCHRKKRKMVTRQWLVFFVAAGFMHFTTIPSACYNFKKLVASYFEGKTFLPFNEIKSKTNILLV